MSVDEGVQFDHLCLACAALEQSRSIVQFSAWTRQGFWGPWNWCHGTALQLSRRKIGNRHQGCARTFAPPAYLHLNATCPFHLISIFTVHFRLSHQNKRQRPKKATWITTHRINAFKSFFKWHCDCLREKKKHTLSNSLNVNCQCSIHSWWTKDFTWNHTKKVL